MKFKLFRSKTPDAGAPPPAEEAPVAAARPGLARSRRLTLLVQLFVVLLAVAGYLVWKNNRDSIVSARYIADSGQLRMLSQRLAKATLQGMYGKAEAFKQLGASRNAFAAIIARLKNGGSVDGQDIPPSPESVAPQLNALAREWARGEQDADIVLKEQKNLIGLGSAVAKVNSSNSQLLALAQQLQRLIVDSGAGGHEVSAAGQLVLLTQRTARNANAILMAETVDPEVAKELREDIGEFRTWLEVVQNGSAPLRVRPAKNPATQTKLKELAAAFEPYHASLSAILSNLPQIIEAKKAALALLGDSEKLLGAAERLGGAYADNLAADESIYYITALVALMLGVLALMARSFVHAERIRRRAAELQEAAARQRNQVNQEAILRLLNEMQSFAEGDLTVRATVSEDITGAIADSINFAIEELRSLVGRINTAAAQVTQTTESAQKTSTELLSAAERQSQEIKTSSAQVLGMARAINDVSGSAGESAGVARASLAAAQKGEQAVRDSIEGMNEIRDQIQETAKRIKRLGESSQEIGEIVELISDITEQTNVLALNAAIQAASAGEAGRGFTVVAEEVQRLAERSGEATKQIGAIVRTIQTDTQDAVSAMERSTQGVVEGAHLSDAAGQALAEIGEVSTRLAALIEDISRTTHAQARGAGDVANSMAEILSVTEQTTAGTQRTAEAVARIAALARDLRSSVANFKL